MNNNDLDAQVLKLDAKRKTPITLEWPDIGKGGQPSRTCANARIAIAALGIECRHDIFHDRKLVAGHAIDQWAGELSDHAIQMLRVLIRDKFGFKNELKMSLDATNMDVGNGGGKTRLLSLGDIDRRTRAFRKTSDLITSIETDLGGADRLSTGERQIIQRAAVTGALIEDMETRWLAGEPIDAAQYATLSNAQRRLFETVGLRRVPREVESLSAYLAKKAAAKPVDSFSGAGATGRGRAEPDA